MTKVRYDQLLIEFVAADDGTLYGRYGSKLIRPFRDAKDHSRVVATNGHIAASVPWNTVNANNVQNAIGISVTALWDKAERLAPQQFDANAILAGIPDDVWGRLITVTACPSCDGSGVDPDDEEEIDGWPCGYCEGSGEDFIPQWRPRFAGAHWDFKYLVTLLHAARDYGDGVFTLIGVQHSRPFARVFAVAQAELHMAPLNSGREKRTIDLPFVPAT